MTRLDYIWRPQSEFGRFMLTTEEVERELNSYLKQTVSDLEYRAAVEALFE